MRPMSLFMAYVLFPCVFMGGTFVQARELGEILSSGKVVVATEGDFFPFNYVEKTQVKGYEVDVGEMVAQKLGVKIEWRIIAFEAIIQAVRQDRIDFAVASHAYSVERAEKVDFATPHYCAGAAIASHKNGSLTQASLKGKTVGVQMATSYFVDAKNIEGVRQVKTYRTELDIFDALKANKIDAWVSDKWLIEATLDKYPGSGIVQGEQITDERNSIIVQKNNTALLERINQIIDGLSRDGSLTRLSMKYWGKDITCKK